MSLSYSQLGDKVVPIEPKAIAAQSASEIMENVLIKGDLSKLTPQERSTYYMRVCESAGLNPLTKPFEYITLNGKLTLYALRACTDQLRTIHNVSVEELTESERDGVFIVTAKVRNAEGRTDMAKGAVQINGLKGDALANALMKAETKAKRRATLSLCGLGFLDETEIETIPDKSAHNTTTGEVFITPDQVGSLRTYIVKLGVDLPLYLKYIKAPTLEQVTDFKRAMEVLENEAARQLAEKKAAP